MANPLIAAALLAIAASLCAPVMAKGEDLANCRYSNGISIEPRVCDALRKLDADDRAQRARSAQMLSEARQREEIWQNEKRDREQRNREARDAERRADDEATARRRAEYEAQEAADDRRASIAARQAQVLAEKRKTSCGSDYKVIRIGMSLQRAQECVSAFKLRSQVNRADGVISTYTSAGTYLHVMDGRIVAWGQ